MDSHGGKIWAHNNKDRKGATFTLTLPLDKRAKNRIPNPKTKE
jgi:signal transduction histidine kinase